MKSCLEKNAIEMYSTTCNEEKSVVAKRFIRTLKNKIYIYDFNIYIKKCGY